MPKYTKINLYTDGGARGNPGPAGIGAVIKNGDEVIGQGSRYIGKTTNNQAEYQALFFGLNRVKEMGIKEVDCFLDSELVVNQLNHKFKVKDPDLGKWFIKIHNLSLNFKKIKFHHIYREDNRLADRLANEAMDRGKN